MAVTLALASGIAGGLSQFKAARTIEKTAKKQRFELARQAESERQAAKEAAELDRQASRRIMARNRALFGISGLAAGGSFTDVERFSGAEALRRQAGIIGQGEESGRRLEAQAGLVRDQASAEASAAFGKGLASILGGLSSASGSLKPGESLFGGLGREFGEFGSGASSFFGGAKDFITGRSFDTVSTEVTTGLPGKMFEQTIDVTFAPRPPLPGPSLTQPGIPSIFGGLLKPGPANVNLFNSLLTPMTPTTFFGLPNPWGRRGE